MADTRNYSIKKNRLRKSCMESMVLQEDGSIRCDAGAGIRHLFLGYLDGGIEGCEWGRFHFQGSFDDNVVVITRIAALDEKEFIYQGEKKYINDFLLDATQSATAKKELFGRMNCIKYINRKDMLLYELEGRYLWIYLEILGEGEGTLSELRVNMEGDNFMYTFPEIYQEKNSFFHRYLSIFSSMYNDFQLDIDNVADKIEIDTAPASLLPVYAGWLGLDIGSDMLEEQAFRKLLKNAYDLNKFKGTRGTIKKVIEIVLDSEVTLVEKSQIQTLIPYMEKETYDKLYGSNSYDLTVLIPDDTKREKGPSLLYLLNQFKPIRTKINLVFLDKAGMLDSYCYLDKNAAIFEEKAGQLDSEQSMNGTMVLE